MKTQPKKARIVKKADKTVSELERNYQTVFVSFPLPYQGLYTEDDSLEQPSAYKYVPSTATPSVVA
jgi:hypothetical protein